MSTCPPYMTLKARQERPSERVQPRPGKLDPHFNHAGLVLVTSGRTGLCIWHFGTFVLNGAWEQSGNGTSTRLL